MISVYMCWVLNLPHDLLSGEVIRRPGKKLVEICRDGRSKIRSTLFWQSHSGVLAISTNALTPDRHQVHPQARRPITAAPFVAAGWEKIILKRSIFDLTAACHRHATHDACESEREAVRFTQSTEEKKFQVVSTCCTLSEGVAQEHGLRPFAPPAK